MFFDVFLEGMYSFTCPLLTNLLTKTKIMYYKYNKEKLAFEKVRISNVFLKSLGVVLALFIILSFVKSPSSVDLSYEDKIIIIKEYNEFSEEKLERMIKKMNFKFPHIILAQAKLETGSFTSQIFKENNNLFGMKEAKLRATLAQGTERNHAYYTTWQESVYDYALYYNSYLRKIKTEDEYFEYLRQNYAEDPNYVSSLKKIILKTKK
jgi:uncharacterized FlgJ-related protein